MFNTIILQVVVKPSHVYFQVYVSFIHYNAKLNHTHIRLSKLSGKMNRPNFEHVQNSYLSENHVHIWRDVIKWVVIFYRSSYYSNLNIIQHHLVHDQYLLTNFIVIENCFHYNGL